MQDKLIEPLVSIIVPALNSEAFLERCLDSLVNQTFSDLEILIIDNHSTDTTADIANEYASKYPGKVFVYSTHQHGSQALGRNLGIKVARGKYIAWCDSDDCMELRAVELMYNKAVENDYDLVVCDFYRHENGKIDLKRPSKEVISDPSILNIILDGKYALWSKFIKTEVYRLVGDMPVDTTHDDVTYVPILIQNCSKPAYLATPVYNWIVREGSVSRSAAAMKKTHIKTYSYLLEHIKPEFLNSIVVNIARMTRSYYDRFYVYGDIQIEYYLKFREKYIVNNPQAIKHPEVRKMEDLILICAKEPMDSIVYINGFNNLNNDEKIKLYEEKAFTDGCKVVILNETTCDIAQFPLIISKYNSGDYQFVAEFFAIKRIYENGGVYLADCIQLNSTLNYLKYNSSFFCYLDNSNISPYIFGGVAKNSVFKDILNTYFDAEFNNSSTSERIKKILKDLYKIPIENVNTVRKRDVWIYPPEMFVLCNHKMHYKNIAEHNFSNMTNSEEYIVAKRSTVAAIGTSRIRGLITIADKYTALNEEYTLLKEKYTLLNERYITLKNKYAELKEANNKQTWQMERIKKSISFKIARLILFPCRVIRDTMGRLSKK